MRRPAPHHWRDQWLREPEAGQAPSGRAGQRGAERWQGLRSAGARRRGIPPRKGRRWLLRAGLPGMGCSCPSWAGFAWATRVPHAWPLQAGACRTLGALCRGASLADPSLFQPEGTAWGGRRTFARGRGAGHGRGDRMLLVARLLPLLPKEERRGYQSRKGRYLGVPALEGSERAVGAGLFRHVGGRRSFCQTGWPGLAAMVVGSRRPRDSVAGRAGGFAPRNMAGGWWYACDAALLGWAGLGRDCVPRGRAAKRGGAEKPFSGLPARRY